MIRQYRFSELTDKELFELVTKDNREAFAEIYNRYWDLLFYLAAKKTRDLYEAENIVQDVFMDLWNRRGTAQIATLKSYLAAAIKYRVINYLAALNRKERYHSEGVFGCNLQDNSTEDWLSFEELRGWLEKCVSALPEKCRMVYQMKQEGFSYKEIASKMNIGEKTVENHIGYALRKLKAKLTHFVNIFLF